MKIDKILCSTKASACIKIICEVSRSEVSNFVRFNDNGKLFWYYKVQSSILINKMNQRAKNREILRNIFFSILNGNWSRPSTAAQSVNVFQPSPVMRYWNRIKVAGWDNVFWHVETVVVTGLSCSSNSKQQSVVAVIPHLPSTLQSNISSSSTAVCSSCSASDGLSLFCDILIYYFRCDF